MANSIGTCDVTSIAGNWIWPSCEIRVSRSSALRVNCWVLVTVRQFTLGRERVQQQDPRATRMELQVCWASDVTKELRMMRRARQISSFPHVALEALSLLLENIEPVASKASLRGCEATVVQQVQRFHVTLAHKGSERWKHISCKAFRGWQTGSERTARLRSQGIEQTRQWRWCSSRCGGNAT